MISFNNFVEILSLPQLISLLSNESVSNIIVSGVLKDILKKMYL